MLDQFVLGTCTLEFNRANWNQYQEVYGMAVTDGVQDGIQSCGITTKIEEHQPASSSVDIWQGYDPEDVSVSDCIIIEFFIS